MRHWQGTVAVWLLWLPVYVSHSYGCVYVCVSVQTLSSGSPEENREGIFTVLVQRGRSISTAFEYLLLQHRARKAIIQKMRIAVQPHRLLEDVVCLPCWDDVAWYLKFGTDVLMLL